MPIVRGLFDLYGHLPVPILHLLLPKIGAIGSRMLFRPLFALFSGHRLSWRGRPIFSEQVNAYARSHPWANSSSGCRLFPAAVGRPVSASRVCGLCAIRYFFFGPVSARISGRAFCSMPRSFGIRMASFAGMRPVPKISADSMPYFCVMRS